MTGRRAFDRETSIAAHLAGMPATAASSAAGTPPPDGSRADRPGPAAPGPVAVISEGLADPHTPLADWPHIQMLRIAPGCLCCAGSVVLRVTLNRLLRRPPAQLFISLADATHVGQLRAMLSAPPYDTLLSLCDDVAAPAIAS